MCRITVGMACALAVAFWLSPASVCIADIKGDGGDGPVIQRREPQEQRHGSAKYTSTQHENGKEVERKYDLSDPTQAEGLVRALMQGYVHELKKDEPPEIIPRRFDLGLWSIIIFLALFFVLKKFAWRPMLEGLHKREENIRGALEQAEKTRHEAMELQAKLDARLKEAGGQIAAMMDGARRDAQDLKTQMVAEAKSDIQHERDRLKHELETAKDQALQEIWKQSVTLASLMSTKAVRRSLTADDHKRLLDESLVELKQAGLGFGKRNLAGSGL